MGISPPQGRYLHTGQHKYNKRIQTSMPRVGFEPTIPALERGKRVHTLDWAATVVDALCGSVETTHQESSPDGNYKGPEMHRKFSLAVDANYMNNIEYSAFSL
jgi:hypothetical protein